MESEHVQRVVVEQLCMYVKVGDTGHGDAPLKIAEKNGAICVAPFLKIFICQFTRYP